MSTDLARTAEAVLERNRRGAWTCPADGIYPHQWLWDSCFVAIGLAAVDPERAADELRALLRAQWTNGMVPHMVFAADVDDLGSTRLWQSRRDPRAPRGVDTSCITQPPVLAIAAWFVSHHLTATARRTFLDEVVPKIANHHRWLYRERDLEHCGLVTLIHPWECGLDTTPPWMDALARFPAPRWMRFVLRWRLARLVRLFRRDTRFVPAAERSSDDDGLRMLALARHARRYSFDRRRFPATQSVLIQDLSFNALLVVANRMLIELAEGGGIALNAELLTSARATPVALEDLWNEEQQRYCSRDATTGRLMPEASIATFLTLWAGLRSDRMRHLVGTLGRDGWAVPFPVPSVPSNSPQFEPDRYWKGPTWVNTNWLIVQGLREQHATEAADELSTRTLDLIREGGCAEYFNPLTGAPHGAREFSWTAALALELLSFERSHGAS